MDGMWFSSSSALCGGVAAAGRATTDRAADRHRRYSRLRATSGTADPAPWCRVPAAVGRFAGAGSAALRPVHPVAVVVAAPAGLIIWLFANIGIDGQSLLTIIANFLDPFAKLMGLDGYILTAFIFGIPANEIVLYAVPKKYLKCNT